MDINENFLEECILKTALINQQYAALISSVFERKYFSSPIIGDLLVLISLHVKEYKTLPSKDILINSAENPEEVKKVLDSVEMNGFDYIKQYEWLLEKTNEYLKESAMQCAILESADIVDKNENIALIRDIVSKALAKDIKVDLGLNYFEDIQKRLLEIAQNNKRKIPFYYPALDELTNGGLPPCTLNFSISQIHGFKTAHICNTAARQVLHGHNVIIFTHEMAEEAYAQRIDAILTKSDINRLYCNQRQILSLAEGLTELKKANKLGLLVIKEFPAGSATVDNYRIVLREYEMRGIKFDIVYSDYMNLMRTPYYKGENTNSKMKYISEEQRQLSFEFDIPLWTCTQFNREGMRMSLREAEYHHISEGISSVATADFVMLLGDNEEDAIYRSEKWYKIVKNRLGGRIGEMNKFYVDQKSLCMYDVGELDLWISDAKRTGDERALNEAA